MMILSRVSALTLALAGTLSGCGTLDTSPAVARVASTPMALRHGPGPEFTNITSQSSPIVVALVAAGLEFGIESLASAITKGAEKYEVKTHVDRAILFGTAVGTTLLSRRHSMKRADVFAVVRTANVAPKAAGDYSQIPPKGDKDLAAYWTACADSSIAMVVDEMGKKLKPETAAGTATEPWSRSTAGIALAKDLIKQAIYALAPAEPSKETVVVLSFAAIVDCDRPAVDSTDAGAEQGYQVALRCYTYPLLMCKKGRRATNEKGAKGVKSMLSLTLEAPDGHENGHSLEYAHSAVFQLKYGAGPSTDVAPWVAGKKKAGWVARDSRVGAAPPTSLLNVRAQILETNNLKKTLESIGKFVGKVSLEPDDIGID